MSERMRRFESTGESKNEFLESRIRISFRVAPEAQEYLPEITKADLESGREKYRLFLGRWSKSGDDADVSIDAIVEFDDDPRAVVEGVYEVQPDIGYMTAYIEELKRTNEEYRDLEIVGDIHTHPVFSDDMAEGVRPWDPSSGDIEDLVRQYSSGHVRADRPFIFAIAAPHPNSDGETVYAYYHLFREDGVWKYRALK